ncbi:HPr family phosphocarrier protein [Gilvimarinus sp. SDUM040013]|uniref:HPr family phosphocarrier protein n=1 Tax=Gilvimarinus gilvus TaxID=3058038 RepID=A0ABU4RSP0_9GAMM|nr:HPr family phosphocarrier protein [Gilvimarinus sp. SDUM040013]MDO3388356.1 HPr family phosphocarrier protein [Gilvimarinus sp. SDUM040013]MDX6847906.1 HPr family phosphocarrier protein [Gilvimarinus sp. SDUM040013]
MPSRDVTIVNRKGLHARSAAKLAAVAKNYTCKIELNHNAKKADCSSVMALMMLAAGIGTELKVCAEGKDANMALEAVCKLIEAGFEELDEDTP